MFDAVADWMSVPLLHWTHANRDTARHGMSHAAIYPYAPFRCRDGEVIVAIQQPAEWRRFCAGVLGQAELAEDARFATNPDRLTHRAELAAIIAAVFAPLSCARGGGAARPPCNCLGPRFGCAGTGPAQGAAADRCSVGGASASMPRPAGRSEIVALPPPQLGEHTAAIRAEFGRD